MLVDLHHGEDNHCDDFLAKIGSHIEMISLAMTNKTHIHMYHMY